MASTSASAAVGEVLRQPDDLLKLAAYRKKLLKEKAALDAKLSTGVKSQLDATRDALLKLQSSRTAVGMIKEEMMAVEKLRNGMDGGGDAFDKITRVSTIHRNFAQVSKMVQNLRGMSDKVEHILHLLDKDRNQSHGPGGTSPNLLIIHFQLQQLEAFRNETLHQAKKSDANERAILTRLFERLDKVGEEFEAWLWQIAECLVELARRGNGGTIVRLVKIIEFEGKEDEKAVAMRLVRKVATTGDAASRFKSMQANARIIKNYRHKFLDTLTKSISRRFDEEFEGCQGDFLGFIEQLGWMYKDIIRIKDDIEPLFPADYEIVPYLVKAYHKSLNATLRKLVDAAPEAKALLELHAWIKEYRVSMKELEIPAAWLQPPLLDGKSQDLIEDYVKLLISKLDEWTTNLMREETAKFQWRTREPEEGHDGQFGMEGVVDFFQLVSQQCDLALDSNQGAVLARVVTESAKVMRKVQAEWLQIVAEEARMQVEKKPEEVPGGLVEYVVALANDQLKSADYAEALSARLEPLVSEKYKAVIAECLNDAIDGYLDVAKKCTTTLVEFVFNDLRPATAALITSKWYTDSLIPQIVETMRDYMQDYQAHLNPSIFDILIEDLLDATLIAYLTALRRANTRSLRMPSSVGRIKNDRNAMFDFFREFKKPDELEQYFEVMDMVISMLGASPQMVFMDYWTFAKQHGPQLGFVEALMKARDDLDRNQVGDIMDTLRRKVREEGITDPPEPTIMVKVTALNVSLLDRLPNVSNLNFSNMQNLAVGYKGRLQNIGGQLRDYGENLRDRL